MATIMNGYSAASGGMLNNLNGVSSSGSHAEYPVLPPGAVQEGYVSAPGSIPMGLMEPGAMGELGSSFVAPPGGFYQTQPPPQRPEPYRDYSRIPLDEAPSQVDEDTFRPNTSGKEPAFPTKLHKILSNPEYQDYIAWLPHGRSWRVLKPKAFEEKVIPLYFRHAKYASFMRQVNGWGFKRMTQGPDHNSYYHEVSLDALVRNEINLFLAFCPYTLNLASCVYSRIGFYLDVLARSPSPLCQNAKINPNKAFVNGFSPTP